MATYTLDPITETFVLSADQSFSVTTDQSDYAPLSTATFTAAGVNAGDVLTFDVTDLNGVPVSGTDQPWIVIASADGTLQTTWAVGADAAGQAFQLTVADQTTGLITTAEFTDSVPPTELDLRAAESSGTVNDAIFTTNVGTDPGGSGVAQAFLRIGADKTESGFNTDFRPAPLDDNSSPNFTHSLKVSDLQAVDANGNVVNGTGPGTFFEFRLDINQDNKNPLLSLDQLQIYQAATGDIGDLKTLQSQQKDYDLTTNFVELNSGLGTGLGHGTIDILVPTTDFQHADTNPFVYLFAQFGNESPSNAGFEQFSALLKSGGGGVITGGGQNPALSIAKSVLSAPPTGADDTGPLADQAGETIAYQVVLKNTGSASATNVVLADTLLQNVDQLVSFTDTGNTDHAAFTLANFETGTLDAGETWTLTYNYTVLQSDIDNNGNNPAFLGSIHNTATVTSKELSPASASVDVPVDQDPSVSIVKTFATAPIGGFPADGTEAINDDLNKVDHDGQAINYNLTVTNTGNETLTGVTIFDSLTGKTFTDLNPLAPNQTFTAIDSYTVTQDQIDAGTAISNTATVTDDQKVTDNFTVQTLIDQDPSVSIVKTFTTKPNDSTDVDSSGNLEVDHAGQEIDYSVTVKNTGNVTLTGVTVTDGLVSLSTGSTTLEVGQSEILTGSYYVTQAQIDAGTAIVNTASVKDGQGVGGTASVTTLIDQDPSINIEKLVSVDGGANWYFTGDSDDSSFLTQIQAQLLPGQTLHLGPAPSTLAGAPVEFEVAVTDNGNVTVHALAVTDHPLAVTDVPLTFTLPSGDLAPGATEISTPVATTTALLGSHSDTATVTGTTSSAGNVSDSDTASYNALGHALPGLSKGFWANHTDVWNGTTNGDKTEVNLFASGVLSTSHNLNPHTYLLLGDGHHSDGSPGDVTLQFDLPSAGQILNNSSSGDAREILAGQALAAQLNDYNDGGQEPNGLIEAAVKWLTTSYTSGQLTGGNVDTNHDGIVESGTTGTIEYNTKTQAFTSPAVSSSSNAWQAFANVFNEGDSTINYHPNTGNAAVDATQYTVTADGEGLKNALAAFDFGGANPAQGFVLSQDGSLIGWTKDGGAHVSDVHTNSTGAFWGILEDQNLLAGTQVIVGVSHA